MITNEFTVWCEADRCNEWHQESVGVHGTKTLAIKRFEKAGWKKVKRKWHCPKCYARYVVNLQDSSS